MKLSKREVILLSFLAIVALIFIEVTLIIGPGLTRWTALNERNTLVNDQINAINMDLTLAKTLETKRDENLAIIAALATPYLDGVSPDSLLLYSHQMLVKHGFSPVSYKPSSQTVDILQSDQPAIYRIKEIADQYHLIETGTTPAPTPVPAGTSTATPTPAPTPATDIANKDAVIIYTLQVDAKASYDQIKSLLDDFASLKWAIIVSNIKMTPDPVIVGSLEVTFSINYYGIEKLTTTEDPINKWSRQTLPGNTSDPFVIG